MIRGWVDSGMCEMGVGKAVRNATVQSMVWGVWLRSGRG